MPARAHFRGHPIHWDDAVISDDGLSVGAWLYSDTGERVGFSSSVRPCAACGQVFAGANHGDPDPCLGNLPGVDNACCGHGVRSQAYVRFTNGVVLRGFTIDVGPAR